MVNISLSKFQTGDIIAFKTKAIWYNPLTWLGPITRKIAKIKYNHVGVVVKIYSEYFVFEAVNKGFLPTKLEEKIKDKKHIKEFTVLRPKYKFSKEEFTKDAVYLLGNKYDYKGLLWNQLILNLFGIWIGRKNNQQNKLYCYEAVAYLHRKIFKNWWKILPKDFYNNENFKIVWEWKI